MASHQTAPVESSSSSSRGESPPTTPTPHESAHMLPPTSPTANTTQQTGPIRSQSSNTLGSMAANPASFRRSPLNPSNTVGNSGIASPFGRSRPGSSFSNYGTAVPRIPSEDSQALGSRHTFAGQPQSGSRGSMILYRLADPSRDSAAFAAPVLPFGEGGHANNRSSVASSSGSVASFGADSKYPVVPTPRGMVPYAYDPAVDEAEPLDDEDYLHYNPIPPNATSKHGVRLSGNDKKRAILLGPNARGTNTFPWRGVLNVSMLLLLILGLMSLFIIYPVYNFYGNDRIRLMAASGNINTNSSGQSPAVPKMTLPVLVDLDTPEDAKSRTGFDGQEYELVFSDEFNMDGRTFYPGDDPFWEAADLWYGVTGDLEWYDPSQVTTKDGNLVITMVDTGPPSLDKNHNLQYKSGMLQSWNKFCFTNGYIEVKVSLPGPNNNVQGYWPGAWTMGNLGRPGYVGSTDGMWPYSYDSCDIGTFPNQTLKDGSGPPSALHSDASRDIYNFELSWLPGQRASACTCPNEDHPGPSNDKGRGAPEIDIFEVSIDKVALVGQTTSQSAQFAPFSHDYNYYNDTTTEFEVFDLTKTRPNKYRGSAVQQAVSSLTTLPATMFQGSGADMKTMGFEYFADPSNRDSGYVQWQVDGAPTFKMGATSVGPDQGDGGSGVSSRLIAEEPMSIVLNLAISPSWQTIDFSTLDMPGIMLVDYVRVYQRKGQTNINCDPKDYPTADYINRHMDAYTNVNATSWRSLGYSWPKNSQWDGC